MKAWSIVLAALGLAGCDSVGSQWKGRVYPDKNDLAVEWKLGRFASLKECQSAAQSIIRWLPDKRGADYECGYKCRQSDFLGGLDVCVTLIRSHAPK